MEIPWIDGRPPSIDLSIESSNLPKKKTPEFQDDFHPAIATFAFKVPFMGTNRKIHREQSSCSPSRFWLVPFRENRRRRAAASIPGETGPGTRGDRRWETATERGRALSQAAAPSPAWQLVHSVDSCPRPLLLPLYRRISSRRRKLRCEEQNDSARTL